MFLKRAVPVGHCGVDELRDLLFRTWCMQGVPPVHAEGAWETLESMSH